MLTDIRHYLPITPTLATAGQPTAAQFAAIRQAGFEVVVNLALPTSDHALPDERAVVAAQGMAYYAIPVQWEQPTVEDFQQFQAVMARHGGQKIFVHCALNMRVSAFVYLHRRLAGVDAPTATATLHQIWQPNEVWAQFIEAVLGDRPEAL